MERQIDGEALNHMTATPDKLRHALKRTQAENAALVARNQQLARRLDVAHAEAAAALAARDAALRVATWGLPSRRSDEVGRDRSRAGRIEAARPARAPRGGRCHRRRRCSGELGAL